jgi:hypothetical protein
MDNLTHEAPDLLRDDYRPEFVNQRKRCIWPLTLILDSSTSLPNPIAQNHWVQRARDTLLGAKLLGIVSV